jgi:hypothetical protein
LTGLIRDLDYCCIRGLVRLNFGDGHDYQIQHKPLALQAMEQQGQGNSRSRPGAPSQSEFLP